jgi:hypothetical protein
VIKCGRDWSLLIEIFPLRNLHFMLAVDRFREALIQPNAFAFVMAIGIVVNPKDALLSEHAHRVLLSLSAFFSSVAGLRGSSA